MIQEIRQSLIEALAEMNYDVGDVTGETVLGKAGLDLESLAVAELAARVEDSFGVRFGDEELESFADMTLDEFANEVSVRAIPVAAVPAPAAVGSVADAG
jgi:acyl carrier protein